MHELSIIQNIIEIAEEELRSRGDQHRVEAIDLQIGELAGVEISSLEFLWPAAVEETVLAKAECHIHRVPATAVCADCQTQFPIQQVFDPCPKCGSHWIDITGGKGMRIKNITLVDF